MKNREKNKKKIQSFFLFIIKNFSIFVIFFFNFWELTITYQEA